MRSHSKLTRRESLALILLLALAALPHLFHLKPSISGFFIGMLTVRLTAVAHPRLLPGRLLLFALTLGGLGNVLYHYPILFGKEAGVALLTSMLALKLMEQKKRRDAYVLVFIGYFTLITQFLYRQELLLLAYLFLVVIGLTAVLVEISRKDPSARLYRPLGVSLSLLAQALPLMLILFIFFPRFNSPLWDLSPVQGQATTGVTDRISPGSISRLSRSTAVAFRVDFGDLIPAPAERYWRGPVLWQTDGREWSVGEAQRMDRDSAPSLLHAARLISYSVTLDPTPGSWLYTLDLPTVIPSGTRLETDFKLTRSGPITRRMRYQATSARDYITGPIRREARERGLQLPSNVTPRMRDLVESWRGGGVSDREVVTRALAYFRREPFFYTLSPPLMTRNPADQFLFESRRGFCGHFATSFALLMRIAGIPARVVAGYQGGEINPLGDYLMVRQSDAHAWSEIWLGEGGWTRVDPTAAVAPQRIEQSLDPDQLIDSIGAPVVFSGASSTLLRSLARQVSMGLDAINTSWQRWVLGYSQKRQTRLMELLGLGFLRGTRLAYGMLAAAGGVVLIMTLTLLFRARERKDPVRAAYDRFCRRLEKRGLARLPHEGPRDFARRVVAARQEHAAAVKAITRLYIGIRYGRMESRENRQRLVRMIRAFRP